MKISFLISLSVLATLNAKSQKFALIDRDLKKPILFTDSVTVHQVSENYFPIKVSDLDSLVANLNYLKTQFGTVQRSKFKRYKLKSGFTFIQVNTIAHAYGDAYDVSLNSSCNNINAEYLLSDDASLNKKAIKKIQAFIKFLANNKDLVIHEFVEYTAVPTDITIYIKTGH